MAASSSDSAAKVLQRPQRSRSKASDAPSILSEVSTVPSAFREQVAQEISTSLIDDVEPKVGHPPVGVWSGSVSPASPAPPAGSRPQAHRPVPANRVMVPAGSTYPRKGIVEDLSGDTGAGWERTLRPARDSPTASVGPWSNSSPSSQVPDPPEVARELAKEETSQIFDEAELPIPPDDVKTQHKDPEWQTYHKKFADSAISTEPGMPNPDYMNTLSNSASATTLHSTEVGSMLPRVLASGVVYGSIVNPLSNSSSAKTLQTWSEVAALQSEALPSHGDGNEQRPTVSQVSSFHWTDSESVAGHAAHVVMSAAAGESDQTFSRRLSARPSGGQSTPGQAVRPSTAEEAAALHACVLANGSFPTPPSTSFPAAPSRMSTHSDDAETVARQLAKDMVVHTDSRLKAGDTLAVAAQFGSQTSAQGSERPSTSEEAAALHAATLAQSTFALPGLPECLGHEAETVLSVEGSDEAASLVIPRHINNAEVLFLGTPPESQVLSLHEVKAASPEGVLFSGNESVMSLAASTLDELAAVQTAQLLASAGEGGPEGPPPWPEVANQEQLASDCQPSSVLLPSKSPAGDSMSGVSVYSLDEPSDIANYGNVADDLVRGVMQSSGHVKPAEASQGRRPVAPAQAVQVAPRGAKVNSSTLGNTTVLSLTTGSEAEKVFAVAGVVGNIMEASGDQVRTQTAASGSDMSVESNAAESAAKDAAAALFGPPREDCNLSAAGSKVTVGSAAKDAAADMMEKSLIERPRRASDEFSNPTRSVVGSSLENSVANGVADKVLENCVQEFAAQAESAAERPVGNRTRSDRSKAAVTIVKAKALSALQAGLTAGSLPSILEEVRKEVPSKPSTRQGQQITEAKSHALGLLGAAAGTGALKQALAEVRRKDKEQTDGSEIARSVAESSLDGAENMAADIVESSFAHGADQYSSVIADQYSSVMTRSVVASSSDTGVAANFTADIAKRSFNLHQAEQNSSVLERSVVASSSETGVAANFAAGIAKRSFILHEAEQNSSVLERSVVASSSDTGVAAHFAAGIAKRSFILHDAETNSSIVERAVIASRGSASLADQISRDLTAGIMQQSFDLHAAEKVENTPTMADRVTDDIMQKCFDVGSSSAASAVPDDDAHKDLIQGFLRADTKSRGSDADRSSPSEELAARSIAGESLSSKAAEDIVGQTIFGCILAEGDRNSISQPGEAMEDQLVTRRIAEEDDRNDRQLVRPDLGRRPSEIFSDEDSSNGHEKLVAGMMIDCLELANDSGTGEQTSSLDRTTEPSLFQEKQRSNRSQSDGQSRKASRDVAEPMRDGEEASVSVGFTATNSIPSAVEGLLHTAVRPTDDDLADIHLEVQQEARMLAEKELLAKTREIDELRAQLQRESQRAQQAEKELAGLRSRPQQQPLQLGPRDPEAEILKEQRDDLQVYLDKLTKQNQALAREVTTQAKTAEQFRQLYLENQSELVKVRDNLEKTRSHDAEELRQMRDKLDDVRNRSVQEIASAQARAKGTDSRAEAPDVNELKDVLLGAARNGDLNRALKQVVNDNNTEDFEEHRARMQETILTASRSGRLEEVLKDVIVTRERGRKEPEESIEEIRNGLKDAFISGVQSGELDRILAEQRLNSDSDRMVEESRLQIRAAILQAADEGVLPRLLQEVWERDTQVMSSQELDETRLEMKSLLMNGARTGQLREILMALAAQDERLSFASVPERLGTHVTWDSQAELEELLEESKARMRDVLLAAAESGELANVVGGGGQLEQLRLRIKGDLTRALKNGELEHRLQGIAEKREPKPPDVAKATPAYVRIPALAAANNYFRRPRSELAPGRFGAYYSQHILPAVLTPSLSMKMYSGFPGPRRLSATSQNNAAAETWLQHMIDEGVEDVAECAAVDAEPAASSSREILFQEPVSSAEAANKASPEKPTVTAPADKPINKAPADKPTKQTPLDKSVSVAESTRRLRAIFYSCDIDQDERGVDWAKKRELVRVCRVSQEIRSFLCVDPGMEEASLKPLSKGDKFSFAQLKAFYSARSYQRLSLISEPEKHQQPQPAEFKNAQRDLPVMAQAATKVQTAPESPRSQKLRQSVDLSALRLSYGRAAVRLTPHVFVSREPILTGLDKNVGLMQTYGVIPELPAGLELDSASGWLHGVPIENTPMTRYEIRAEFITADGKERTVQTTIELGVGQAAAGAHFNQSGASSPQPHKDRVPYASNERSSPVHSSRPQSRTPLRADRYASPRPSSRESASVKSRLPSREGPALANEMYDYAIECTESSDINGLKALIRSGVLHPSHLDNRRVINQDGKTLLEVARANGDAKVLSLLFGFLVRDVGRRPQPIVESVPQTHEQSRRSLYLTNKLELQGTLGSFFYPTVPDIIPLDSPCSHLPKLSAGLKNISEFSVWPPFPKGLELDKFSGELFGVPEEEVEEEIYTVTATLDQDQAKEHEDKMKCQLQFSIEEIQPPCGLSYPSVQRIVDSIRADEMLGPTYGLPELRKPMLQKKRGSIGDDLAPIAPAMSPRASQSPRKLFRRPPNNIRVLPTLELGTATNFEVDPPLPLGMTLDSATGEIRGAPALNERKSCATNHTVLAENAEGMALCGLTIEVTTGAWDLSMLHMRTTWTKNQNDLEDQMRTTSAQKGRRATEMRKKLEPISRPKDLGRVDWQAQIERSIGILEQFAHLIPVQQLDGKSAGSMIVKGMDASSLLKCLGIKEDPHTVTALIQAVEFAQAGNPQGAVLGTAEGKKNKESIIFLRASGECATDWMNPPPEKKVEKINEARASQLHDQAFALAEFKPTNALKKTSMRTLGDDKNTWTKENLDREFNTLMPHWKDRMFTGGLTEKLKRFKSWRGVCLDISAPELSEEFKELD